MKQKLRKWYRAGKSPRASQYIIHSYQALYSDYKNLVLKTKNDSWKRFCSETESTSDLARLAKIIRYHPKFDLGMLKDENGDLASTPERTLEILTEATFPGSEVVIDRR